MIYRFISTAFKRRKLYIGRFKLWRKGLPSVPGTLPTPRYRKDKCMFYIVFPYRGRLVTERTFDALSLLSHSDRTRFFHPFNYGCLRFFLLFKKFKKKKCFFRRFWTNYIALVLFPLLKVKKKYIFTKNYLGWRITYWVFFDREQFH